MKIYKTKIKQKLKINLIEKHSIIISSGKSPSGQIVTQVLVENIKK
jgi:hypothetical protein